MCLAAASEPNIQCSTCGVEPHLKWIAMNEAVNEAVSEAVDTTRDVTHGM